MPSLQNQVICEGDGDRGFIERLSEQYALPEFEITCFSEQKGGLERVIAAYEVFAANRHEVRRILIVADSDDDGDRKLSKIRKMLKKAGFPKPTAALQVRGGDDLKVGIVLLPAQKEEGNLETLFLKDVAARNQAIFQCATSYVTCERAGRQDDWRRGDRDKMVLRSIIAATVQEDPNCSLNYVWGKTGCPMDITSQEFKFVADFIADLFAA